MRERAAQTVWDHLAQPRYVPELVERLFFCHAADVAIETARSQRDLASLISITPQLEELLGARVAPILSELGLRIERLSIERLEDHSRWDFEA